MEFEALIRYSRQIQLNEIGLAGQTLLKKARVLCIGVGGLGCPLLLYLAGAGVGNLGIIDDDTVSLENLPRQILFSSQDTGKKKIQAAKSRLLQMNPDLNIEIYDQIFNDENALNLVRHYDIVADCSDNFATRYLVSDICFAEKKPFVYASLFQFQAHCSFFDAPFKPCFRCLFPDPPAGDFQNCNQAGVLGVLPGLLGTLQATLILKWILKIGENPLGCLWTIDIRSLEFKTIFFSQDPHCRLCVQQYYDFLHEPEIESLDFRQLAALMAVQENAFLLDVRTPQEFSQYNIGGRLIPLGELSQRLHELDKQALIIVCCQTGPRSLQAAKILRANQFRQVKYLIGGLTKHIRDSQSRFDSIQKR